MSHDEDKFAEPNVFNPDRFLDLVSHQGAHTLKSDHDPKSFVFGFGRRSVSSPNMSKRHAWKPNHALLRICPGRYFAEASLLICTASILHVFNIRPPLDEHGVPLKLKYRATDDMVSYVSRSPLPHIPMSLRRRVCRHVQGYEYVIEPRRPQAERLVGEIANAS